MEFSAIVKPIPTPNSSLEPAPAEFTSPKTFTLVISSNALEIQPFTDLGELNNRVVTLAKHFNMSVEDLLRGGHIAVFTGVPSKLTAPLPVTEVLRVE